MPSRIIFYYKQVRLLLKYKARLTFKSLSVIIEKNVYIFVATSAQINIGRRACLRKGVDIEAHDEAIINIGDNFFINKNSSIIARFGIDIGSNCMIADHVSIYDHDHDYIHKDTPFGNQGYVGDKITIGNNVWIGSKTFIGRGVSIGDNVVIGANTLLRKSVPSNTRVFGKVILVMEPLWCDNREQSKFSSESGSNNAVDSNM